MFHTPKKAFDTVNHEILLKIVVLWVPRKMYNLFNRLQYVVGGSWESKTLEISCGVPQGSVYGPIFLHFIIDMNDSIKSGHCIVFADDTTVFKNSFKSCISMNQDQKFLHKWLEKNYLTLNRSKCQNAAC